MERGQKEIWIGIIVLIASVLLYLLPEAFLYEPQQSDEQITIGHSNNYEITNIDFNFITFSYPQQIYIYYAVRPLQNENGSLSIVLPYDGKAIELPSNWQTKKFNSGTTVLYKNFTCYENSPCQSEDNLLKFDLVQNIVSWRTFRNYITIPFANNPSNHEIIDFINELNRERSFSFGWSKADSSNVKITIEKQYDEWNAIPTPFVSSIPNEGGGNNIVFNWSLKDDPRLFIVSYNGWKDRISEIRYQLVFAVLFATGVTFIFHGKTTISNDRQQKQLQKFIKVQRHMQDANTAFTLKNYESAKISYDLASKIDPQDIDPLLLAGNSFYEMKYFDDAIPYFEKVLEIDQKYVGALNNIGACYAGLGDHEKAITYYEKVLEINPNHLDTLNNFGAVILDLGFLEYAIPYFDEGLKINKKDVMAIANKGKAISYDDHKKALTLFDEALKINPNKIEPLTFKALSLISLARFDEALSCLNLILKIEPLHKEAIHNKGTVLINLNRTREALDCFNEFLVARPQDSNALFNKGLCLESFGDKTKAIECFNEALRYGINDLTILNKIGGQFTLYGDPNRAIKECFQKILNEDENNIDAMYGMYLAFTKLGNKIESETWHQKYLNARTNSASD